MYRNNSKTLALASVAASVALILAAFTAVWLLPREAGPASAQNGGTAQAEKPSTITVRGSGSIAAKPDTLVMTVGANVQESTIGAAQTKVSGIVTAMEARLKAAGIETKDYRTTQYNVETVMDFNGKEGQPQKVTGFRVVNMIEITFRDPSKAAAVLDELVAAGANTIYSGGYTLSNPNELQKQAYDKAIADAQERATRLAGLSGMKLGKIVSVTEASANVIAPGVYDKSMGMGAGGGAVYPGQQTVGVDLIVTYEAK